VEGKARQPGITARRNPVWRFFARKIPHCSSPDFIDPGVEEFAMPLCPFAGEVPTDIRAP